MASPFLTSFAVALVARLIKADLLEIQEGSHDRVATYLANGLARSGSGSQAISLIVSLLVSCDVVEELWGNDEQIKVVIQDLQS